MNNFDYSEFKTRADKSSRHTQGLADKAVYTLLEPVNYKTKVRGYWQDNNGKVCKDWLLQTQWHSWQVVRAKARLVCKEKAQQCVFVKGIKIAYIINPNGAVIQVFKSKKIIYLKTIKGIRQAIKQYKDGLTIYKTVKGYFAEVYI